MMGFQKLNADPTSNEQQTKNGEHTGTANQKQRLHEWVHLFGISVLASNSLTLYTSRESREHYPFNTVLNTDLRTARWDSTQ